MERKRLQIVEFYFICVGKLKEDYLKKASKDYEDRLSKFGKVNIFEVKNEKEDNKSALLKEGERIIQKIPKNCYNIALEINGNEYDSTQFAKRIDDISVSFGRVCFIIGGSNGISEDVLKLCDEKISFSKMTFPHKLFRIMLLEQVYRGCMINAGYRYHK